MPYPWKFSSKLLGMQIDCHWSFGEHVKELRSKKAKRLSVLRRVANSTQGLGSRVLSITTHSLIDRCALTKAARNTVSTGTTIRREIVHVLADTRSFRNHYILKSANVVDRVLRAQGSSAPKQLKQFISNRDNIGADERQHPQDTEPEGGVILYETNIRECKEGNITTGQEMEERVTMEWMIYSQKEEAKRITDKDREIIYEPLDEDLVFAEEFTKLLKTSDFNQRNSFRVGL